MIWNISKSILLNILLRFFQDDFREMLRFIRDSMYYVFVADWLSVFPRDQMLILHAEGDYYANRTHALDKIFQFLGVTPLKKDDMTDMEEAIISNTAEKFIERSKIPMMNITRKLLGDFFRPHNVALSDLLNDDRFIW